MPDNQKINLAKEKVLFSWSGGKDSTLALYELRKAGNYEVMALLTTITEEYDRISMHGVRRVLLERQAKSLGITLEKVLISKNTSNEQYEAKMRKLLEKYAVRGVRAVVFGDVFLEDLRKYREDNLAGIGMKGIFPIWQSDTGELARTFMNLGFKAVITCIDSNAMDASFVGRDFDEEFLSQLPATIDPCGENGQFHTFVYDGPIFREKIPLAKGEVVFKENRFYYCDLMPVEDGSIKSGVGVAV